MHHFEIMLVTIMIKTVFNILVVSGCYGYAILNHNTKDAYDACTQFVPCLRKCCPEHHVLHRRKCVFAPEYEFNIEVYDGTDILNKSDVSFNVIHSKECAEHEINVLLPTEEDQMFYLQPDGTLFRSNVKEFVTFEHFCLENFVYNQSEVELWAYVCYESKGLQSRNQDTIGSCSEYLGHDFLCTKRFLLAVVDWN